ncbi:hypothetical protein JHK87_033913 [Glycine soja]|nr:hypothetical protein JHK87_033913 [Glycine soja]
MRGDREMLDQAIFCDKTTTSEEVPQEGARWLIEESSEKDPDMQDAITHDQDVWSRLEKFKPEHFWKDEDVPIMGV